MFYHRRCRTARLRFGATQRETASGANVSQQTVSKFERGLSDNASLLLYYMAEFMNETDVQAVINYYDYK